MIEIYFDGVLIDDNNYISIRNVYKLFNDSFLLGSVSSNTMEIEVPSSIQVPTDVTIIDDNGDYGCFVVDKYEFKDNDVLKLTLMDKMVLFEKGYNAKPIIDEKAELGEDCTLKDILEDICDTFGVVLGTTSFINDDEVVDFYDNTRTARQYISYIAEVNGGFAQIGKDGKLYLRKFLNGSSISLNTNVCENFKLGEHHVIQRVVYDNGTLHYETSNDDTLETLYLNSENVYINTQAQFTATANAILGFSFYNFKTGNCPINSNAQAGYLLNITNGNNTYTSIVQYDVKYNGGWLGGYELDLNSQIQEETKVVGDSDAIKNIKIEVNRLDNEVQQAVELVDSFSGDISLLQQNQDSISSSVSSLTQGYYEYNYTTNTTFQDAKSYYELVNGNYVLLTYDSTNHTYTTSDGTIYNVGDAIPSNTIYERGNMVQGVNDIRTDLYNFVGSYQRMTNNAIETFFANTHITDQMNQLGLSIESIRDDLEKYDSYISMGQDLTPPVVTTDTEYQANKRYYTYNSQTEDYDLMVLGTDYNVGDTITGTKYTSEHYKDSYITLGARGNQTTITIYPDEVVFFTGGVKTAYISDDSLYIEESTILTKEKIGHWLTYEDSNGNLNTKWVNDR